MLVVMAIPVGAAIGIVAAVMDVELAVGIGIQEMVVLVVAEVRIIK